MRLFCVCLLVLIALGTSSSANAQDCPPVPSLTSSDINSDTRASLSALKSVLANLGLSNEFRKNVRNIFVEHPEAIQWYVVLVMYHDGCVAIRDDRSLSSAERLSRLDTLRKATLPQF